MRTLIELAAETICWDEDPQRLLLVPLSGRLRTASGRDVVKAIRGDTCLVPRPDAGRRPVELRRIGLGVRSMLAVVADPADSSSELTCDPIAVIDGWNLLGNAAGVDLSFADLAGANLQFALLRGCVLRRARLCGADLSRADLSCADVSHADLQGAKLVRADLTCADLSFADCRRIDVKEALLTEAVTEGSVWRGADVWSAKVSDTDFAKAFTEGFDCTRGDYRGAKLRAEEKAEISVRA